MPHIPASQALARFRVIDMTQVRAGPTAARQLADWGADQGQLADALGDLATRFVEQTPELTSGPAPSRSRPPPS